MSKKVIVKQPLPPNDEVPVEVIASSIVEIANAMKIIDRSRLSRKAIVTLIHHQSKISQRDIGIVLNNLSELESDWLK